MLLGLQPEVLKGARQSLLKGGGDHVVPVGDEDKPGRGNIQGNSGKDHIVLGKIFGEVLAAEKDDLFLFKPETVPVPGRLIHARPEVIDGEVGEFDKRFGIVGF